MDFWGWIVLIFVICGILYSFKVFDSDMDADGWRWAGKKVMNVVLFIPILIVGTVIHVAGDFKNHKVGYIMLLLVLSFIIFGFYMGYRAGPAGPGPWE